MKKAKKQKAAAAGVDAGSPSETVIDDRSGGFATQEKIAELAYAFWEARGRREGSPEDDWFRAENELRQRARQG